MLEMELNLNILQLFFGVYIQYTVVSPFSMPFTYQDGFINPFKYQLDRVILILNFKAVSGVFQLY